MSDWDNIPWVYQDWVPLVGIGILGIALVASVIWFIAGIIKYGYWWKKDNEE